MNQAFDIRFVQKTEINELVKLCEAHAVFEKSDYDKDGKKAGLLEALFAQTPSLFCLVAEKEGKLLGYATYMKQYATWDADFYIYMDCLFLEESARNLGIGAELVNRIKEEAKKLGCDLIQWQTPAFNKRAMKFYERIGATSKSKERYFLFAD